MATHFVVDLETLGIRDTAVVLSVGLAILDDETGDITSHHWILDADEQAERGRTIDYGTVRWWATVPDNEARNAVFDNDGATVSVCRFVSEFCRLMYAMRPVAVWGNSNSFDLHKLYSLSEQYADECLEYDEHACATTLQEQIPFYKEGDIRSLGHVLTREQRHALVPFSGIKHHAEYDASHEARVLWEHIKIRRDHYGEE